MNEKLTERVVEWVGNAAQQIGDFASKEVPPFIVEFLNWKFWENAIHVLLYFGAVAFFAGLLFATYKLTKWLWDKNVGDDEFLPVLSTIIFSISCVVYVVVSVVNFPVDNAMDCVKIKIAPKVYLIEKAADFIKK